MFERVLPIHYEAAINAQQRLEQVLIEEEFLEHANHTFSSELAVSALADHRTTENHWVTKPMVLLPKICSGTIVFALYKGREDIDIFKKFGITEHIISYNISQLEGSVKMHVLNGCKGVGCLAVPEINTRAATQQRIHDPSPSYFIFKLGLYTLD